MPLTPEQIRAKIESHVQIERAAAETWPEGSMKRAEHDAKLGALQEILTFIDSGGADAL